jgi:hypothetical protein
MKPFRWMKLLVAAGIALGMLACFSANADARHYTPVNPFKSHGRRGSKPVPAPVLPVVRPPAPLPSPTTSVWKPPTFRPAPLPVVRPAPFVPRWKR